MGISRTYAGPATACLGDNTPIPLTRHVSGYVQVRGIPASYCSRGLFAVSPRVHPREVV
jgi:hypothetical protein